MRPHGCDLDIPTRFNPEDTLTHAVNAIRKIWGDVIIEIDSPIVYFVYRSKEAADSWDIHGWNEKYAKDLVHLLIDLEVPQELGVVLEDDQDPVLLKIIDAITEALR
jgi:hypothetical protein